MSLVKEFGYFGSVWAIVNSGGTSYYPSPWGTNMKTLGDKIAIWPCCGLHYGDIFEHRLQEVSAILDAIVGSNDEFFTLVRGVSWMGIWRER